MPNPNGLVNKTHHHTLLTLASRPHEIVTICLGYILKSSTCPTAQGKVATGRLHTPRALRGLVLLSATRLRYRHCWGNGCAQGGLNKCTKHILKLARCYFCVQMWSRITQVMEEEKQETVLRLLIKARFGTDIPSCRHSAGRM